jgi:hypothetical protein
MTNPRRAVVTTVVAAGVSLSVVAVVLNSLVAGGMVIGEIETSEHADEVFRISQLPEDVGIQQTLNLNGHWKKPMVTVSFIPRGVSQPELEQMIETLEETVRTSRDVQITNSTTTFAGWPDLLFALSSSTSVPSLQIIERGSENADIKVYLEAESHPDRKIGLAKIARNKITYEIVYAEVRIYSVHELQKDDMLGLVFNHELGHALGIGHATFQTSIMHSPIVIMDNTAIGDIGACEAEGVSHLYSGGSIGEINCAPQDSVSS